MKLPKTKYKGIYPFISCGKYIRWNASKMTNGIRKNKIFTSEREAALFYDKLLIEIGENPVNILKPKQEKQ